MKTSLLNIAYDEYLASSHWVIFQPENHLVHPWGIIFPHLYLFVLIITLYWPKTSNLFYPGLSGKTMSYDKAKLVRTRNLRLAQLMLHLCDEAAVWKSSSNVSSTECFSHSNSRECLKRKKRNQNRANTRKHVSQKCTKSQTRIEFSLKSYVTGPSRKLGQGECANCSVAFE